MCFVVIKLKKLCSDPIKRNVSASVFSDFQNMWLTASQNRHIKVSPSILLYSGPTAFVVFVLKWCRTMPTFLHPWLQKRSNILVVIQYRDLLVGCKIVSSITKTLLDEPCIKSQRLNQGTNPGFLLV